MKKLLLVFMVCMAIVISGQRTVFAQKGSLSEFHAPISVYYYDSGMTELENFRCRIEFENAQVQDFLYPESIDYTESIRAHQCFYTNNCGSEWFCSDDSNCNNQVFLEGLVYADEQIYQSDHFVHPENRDMTQSIMRVDATFRSMNSTGPVAKTHVYPNPFSEKLVIITDKEQLVVITDAVGKCVFSGMVGNTVFNTSLWSSGLYMVRQADGNVQKFLKE